MLPNDILFCIGSQITSGIAWKSWVQVCKFNYHLSITSLAYKRYEVYNQLLSLLKLYPDKPWNLDILSRNPNITMDNVIANPDTNSRRWDWHDLSGNPNVTMDFIKANPNKPWSWDRLSDNPNITMDFVKANPDTDSRKWNWYVLSRNRNITMD